MSSACAAVVLGRRLTALNLTFHLDARVVVRTSHLPSLSTLTGAVPNCVSRGAGARGDCRVLCSKPGARSGLERVVRAGRRCKREFSRTTSSRLVAVVTGDFRRTACESEQEYGKFLHVSLFVLIHHDVTLSAFHAASVTLVISSSVAPSSKYRHGPFEPQDLHAMRALHDLSAYTRKSALILTLPQLQVMSFPCACQSASSTVQRQTPEHLPRPCLRSLDRSAGTPNTKRIRAKRGRDPR